MIKQEIHFEVVEGGHSPSLNTDKSAGIGIKSIESKVIAPKSSALFRTGLKVHLPSETVGLLLSDKMLNEKHAIRAEGYISEDDEDEIVVRLYNNSLNCKRINSGDNIADLVVVPIWHTEVRWNEQ